MSELGPTLEDLHAEIGKTLVVWGWLEGEMIDAGINWRHASPDAAAHPLKTFLQDLAEPRGVRNAIAHGLVSAHGNPWTPEVEPYVTCRTLDAGVSKITLGDLRRTLEAKVFTHVMIGSNDLERSRRFFDATFLALGGNAGEMDPRGRLIYVHEGSRLMITKPIDGKPATAANGGTIGILAANPEQVSAWHAAGAQHGGTAIETPPSQRPNGSFVAYLRDPDGNKLSVRTRPSK